MTLADRHCTGPGGFTSPSTLLAVAQLGFSGQLLKLDLTVALPG